MRPALPIGLAVALCACLAPAASAGPHIAGSSPAKLIAKVQWHHSLASDGDRLALIGSPKERRLRLVDDAAGRTREVDLGCIPLGGSRGVFLVRCLREDGAYEPRLFFARTLETRPVRGAGPRDDLSGIGRRWVVGEVRDEARTVYLNRRTGERREEPQADGLVRPARDLDSPGLERLAPQPAGGAVAFSRGPLTALLRFKRPELSLHRDGKRVTRLSRCRSGCDAVQVGQDRAAWAEVAGWGARCDPEPSIDSSLRCWRIRSYAIDGAQRFEWRATRVEDGCELGCEIEVAVTRRRVYIQLPTSIRSSSGASRSIAYAASSRVYAARAPG
jgi:hypothetical protein